MKPLRFVNLKIGMVVKDTRVDDVVYEIQAIEDGYVELLGNDGTRRAASSKAFDVSEFFTEVL